MPIKINNAILHVLNSSDGRSVLSRNELDIESEACEEFITKHVKKLLSNSSAKEACFNASSKTYELVSNLKNGEMFFKDMSIEICGILSEIMAENPDIPSGALLIVRFELKHDDYLAILKLNYKECFTHTIADSDNQIVKYNAVLPFGSGRVEEACLIPFDPMIIRLLEKPYEICGEMRNYFSEIFLDCDAEISKKEAVRIINQATEEITERYYENDVTVGARLKTTLIEQAGSNEGTIDIQSAVEEVFLDNEDAKMEYIGLIKESGIKPDMVIGEKFTRQQFGTQRIKAENGIEIKIPSDISTDTDFVEIIRNDDGTTSMLLKRLGRLQAK